jgi:hypothetical protein
MMLKTTLEILVCLGERDYSTSELCAVFHISSMTLKREISDARNMGAIIDSVRTSEGNFYRLSNWKECKKIVTTWLDLIEQDTVVR